MHAKSLPLCPTLQCYGLWPPGSSAHGILQARILEWAAISSSRRSSQPRDRTQVSALQADSLPSEPLGVKKKKKWALWSSLFELVLWSARGYHSKPSQAWVVQQARGEVEHGWQWLGRKALESDQCGLESQLRIIPENENGPDKWRNLSEPQFRLLYNWGNNHACLIVL